MQDETTNLVTFTAVYCLSYYQRLTVTLMFFFFSSSMYSVCFLKASLSWFSLVLATRTQSYDSGVCCVTKIRCQSHTFRHLMDWLSMMKWSVCLTTGGSDVCSFPFSLTTPINSSNSILGYKKYINKPITDYCIHTILKKVKIMNKCSTFRFIQVVTMMVMRNRNRVTLVCDTEYEAERS